MAINPLILLTIFPLFLLLSFTDAGIPRVFSGGSWQTAHATFYGGNDASGTMGQSTLLKHIFQEPYFIYHYTNSLKQSALFLVPLIYFCFCCCYFRWRVWIRESV